MWRNRKQVFFIILTLIAGFFVVRGGVVAEEVENTLVISEIMFDPDGLNDKRKWIEVRNTGNESAQLKTWKLVEGGSSHGIKDCSEEVLKPKSLATIAEDKASFLKEHKEYVGVVCDSSFTSKFNTKGETLLLQNENKVHIFEIDYAPYLDNFEEGHSLEMCLDEKWQPSAIIGGSPGEENCETPDIPIHIRFSELLPDPTSVPDNEGEFVEVYNYGDEKIDLSGWKIDKEKLSGEIMPGEYRALYAVTSLKNSEKDTVVLFGPFGEVDMISYEDAPPGKSYAFDGKKWHWTPIVTSNKPNAFPKAASGARVRLNEILPNPEGDESGEFIELYNAGKQDVDLQFWSLQDKSKAYTFSEKTIIKPGDYFVVKKKIFTFSINNSDEEISLLDPAGNIVDVMSFQKSKEGVSLGYDGTSWRACKKPTPGEDNIFNNAPGAKSVDVPKKAYKDVYAYFSVKTKDGDGDETKVRWEFGDGKKSYKKETKHKYAETGTYEIVLKIDDGKEEVKKKFTVKVKKYPKEKVKIRGVMPNPKGKDTEGEYITLKNFEDKSIDLEGWSIATGRNSKKLVNHPITESFIIPAGESRKITREESKFTLGNKKSRIELRYPNGKLAYKVKYKREDGVEEDELYTKEDGEWIWENGTDETESVTVQPSQKEDAILILPSDSIGRVTERESIFSEVVRTWNGESQVLGAKTYRLEKQGSRYIFTRALSEEHYIKPVLRKVREQFRRI